MFKKKLQLSLLFGAPIMVQGLMVLAYCNVRKTELVGPHLPLYYVGLFFSRASISSGFFCSLSNTFISLCIHSQ